MSNIVSASKLLFFKTEKYHYESHHSFDTSNCPRPHFCMGLVLSGNGRFIDCRNNDHIFVKPGDIIFVPIASTYISEWHGSPDIEYISVHFIFENPGIFTEKQKFKLQKITTKQFKQAKLAFKLMHKCSTGSDEDQLRTLGIFYRLIQAIFPELQRYEMPIVDKRIDRATKYIDENYAREITIDELAALSQMSVSRFYPAFKAALGVTPTDYINRLRISRAIILLMDDETSIEEISEKVGFESSAYFRRVFKDVTGKSPREYRKTAIEL